jgi:hypothetical protein
MTSKFKEEDLGKIKRISIEDRESKVRVESFVDPESIDSPLDRRALMGKFPEILKGRELGCFVDAIKRARDERREILWMIGAHVLKTGLSLYLNSLMKKGYITAIATTGSATVHDLELAFFGKTSEDVAVELPRGRFGMVKETSAHFVAACRHAEANELGLGEGLGAYIESSNAPHGHYSVFAGAHRAGIPATVHVALGTDITHQHPEFPAALAGELSMKDFRILTRRVGAVFNEGAVVLFGSAVILPEVFLKAVSIGYNLGRKPVAVTAANFDMLPQYRVRENVLRRPFHGAGKSYAFQGHHEIMLPLLYSLLAEE